MGPQPQLRGAQGPRHPQLVCCAWLLLLAGGPGRASGLHAPQATPLRCWRAPWLPRLRPAATERPPIDPHAPGAPSQPPARLRSNLRCDMVPGAAKRTDRCVAARLCRGPGQAERRVEVEGLIPRPLKCGAQSHRVRVTLGSSQPGQQGKQGASTVAVPRGRRRRWRVRCCCIACAGGTRCCQRRQAVHSNNSCVREQASHAQSARCRRRRSALAGRVITRIVCVRRPPHHSNSQARTRAQAAAHVVRTSSSSVSGHDATWLVLATA